MRGMDGIRNIVILTGAGISAESGLRTFRADDGLWEDHRVEDVASPQGFRRDPELVQRFYDARRENVMAAEPNAAHRALTKLDRGWDGTLTDLAVRYGWYDQAHFTRDFTALVGVPPGQYRDRVLDADAGQPASVTV